MQKNNSSDEKDLATLSSTISRSKIAMVQQLFSLKWRVTIIEEINFEEPFSGLEELNFDPVSYRCSVRTKYVKKTDKSINTTIFSWFCWMVYLGGVAIYVVIDYIIYAVGIFAVFLWSLVWFLYHRYSPQVWGVR